MAILINKTKFEDIHALRELFLFETHCQSRFHATHHRGRSDTWLILHGTDAIGYGAVKGLDEPDRNTIFEFHILPPYRELAIDCFLELIRASGATFIECQTNHALLAEQLMQFVVDIHTTTILFKDDAVTELPQLDRVVRSRREGDDLFEHHLEPAGDHVLVSEGRILATGGFLTHYNPPFADLYMEVHPDHRRKGHGSFLVQELKKLCYLSGRVPAARCDLDNQASRATLLRSGMTIAGYIRRGRIVGR
jgi:GNAT superfamily N-acetyltransferase